jgi:hypothetical protein
MTMEAVDEIADGRVWIGAEAKGIGLIDGVSTIDDVLFALQQQTKGRVRAVAEQNNEFVSESRPPAGLTLEQTLDSVLAAVEGANERFERYRSLRAQDNRRVGADRFRQLRSLHAELGELMERCAGISTETPAAEADDTPAEPAATEPEFRDSLRQALEASRLVAN